RDGARIRNAESERCSHGAVSPCGKERRLDAARRLQGKTATGTWLACEGKCGQWFAMPGRRLRRKAASCRASTTAETGRAVSQLVAERILRDCAMPTDDAMATTIVIAISIGRKWP